MTIGGGLFSFLVQKSASKMLKRGILHTLQANDSGAIAPPLATLFPDIMIIIKYATVQYFCSILLYSNFA